MVLYKVVLEGKPSGLSLSEYPNSKSVSPTFNIKLFH